MTEPIPFTRTTCGCPICVSGCTSQPGSLAPGDIERIAAYLHQPMRTVLAKFWSSPGALATNTARGQTWHIGTITPKLRDGRCVFLDESDRCTIHPVAPFGCAYFDTHLSAAEGQPRRRWLTLQQASAAYQSLRRTLDVATS